MTNMERIYINNHTHALRLIGKTLQTILVNQQYMLRALSYDSLATFVGTDLATLSELNEKLKHLRDL